MVPDDTVTCVHNAQSSKVSNVNMNLYIALYHDMGHMCAAKLQQNQLLSTLREETHIS